MRKHAIRLMTLVVLFSACTSEATEPTVSSVSRTAVEPTVATVGTTPDGPVGLFASELVEFNSCDAFLAHVKREGLERVGPFGFNTGGGRMMIDLPLPAVAMEDTEASNVTDSAAPVTAPDFSTTNVQEVGVDEPDLIKTDGLRILALAQGTLHYVDVSSGAPVLVSSLDVKSWRGREIWNHQLFMSGDTVLLVASGHWDDRGETTLVLRIDLADPENLRTVDTLSVAGRFVSSRLVGERVALVLSSIPQVALQFVYPSSSSRSAELRAERVNRMVIKESTIEDWVPRYELSVGDTFREGQLFDCSTGYAPQEFSGFEMLSVLTFEVTQDMDAGAVATVMSGGNTVYASTDRLYVATQRWIDWGRIDERDALAEAETVTTHIHRFDIGAPDGASYEASGSVDGFLLNQFAMSEHEGYLRVASTDLPAWGWWQNNDRPSMSRVDVMERDGQELRIVGSVGGLGANEQIFAVRFLGDTGYVVTFRRTDPLYTIDLSDPTNPVVLGELKILGYSAYLHPIGDGLLLGVGQDADDEGRIKGTQVSVFDVSDLANPVRTHQFSLPENSSSEVEYNHKAFLYWEPTGMVVLPFGWWSYDEETGTQDAFHGVLVLEVRSDGIEERGTIEHRYGVEDSGRSTGPDDLEFYFPEYVPIRRSLMIGDTLFSLSEAGLKGSSMESLSEVSWIPFPFEGYYPIEY